MILPRRKFLICAAALLAAPAIVRYESLMRVKPISDDFVFGAGGWTSDVRITRGISRYDREFVVSFWCSVDRGKWQYVSFHQSGDVKIQEAVRA